MLPPQGGKALCYELPATLLKGTTVVLDGSPSPDSPERRSPGKIVRINPLQLHDSATLELLSGCDVSLLAVEGAERISQWAHRYAPSYQAVTRALELLKPSVTLALCGAAARDVQGDIICQLGMLDAHRVAAPLELPGVFLEARMFRGKEARLDAIARLAGTGDGRTCVVVPESCGAGRVAEGLAARGAKVAHAPHAGDAEVTVAAVSELQRAAEGCPSRAVFAYSPASLGEWLLQIGSLAGKGSAGDVDRVAVGLFAVEDEIEAERRAAEAPVTADEIVNIHRLVVDKAAGGMLRIAEDDLCGLSGLTTDGLAHTLVHLERLGAVFRLVDGEHRMLNLRVELDALSPDSISRLAQHLERLSGHRARKVDEVAEFVHSRSCRRRLLAEAAGFVPAAQPCSLCDNCSPAGSSAALRSRGGPRDSTQPAPGKAEELVVKCVRKLPLGVDKAELVGLLSGTVPKQVAAQIDRDDFLGALEVLGGAKVREIVESMVAIGTLIERRIVVADRKLAIVEAPEASSDARLRPAGRGAKAEPSQPPALSRRPVDFDLLSKLRDWRSEIAHRRRIRPNEVVLDSDLRVIAQMKPVSSRELRDCVGMSWQRIKRWAQGILGIVRAEDPAMLAPSPAAMEEPESIESLMASLNTDDARAKVDAIRALKEMGDPRSYEALDRVSLDVTEPLVVRLYAGIAKRVVLKGPGEAPRVDAADVPGVQAEVGAIPGAASESIEADVQDAKTEPEVDDFKLKYPT